MRHLIIILLMIVSVFGLCGCADSNRQDIYFPFKEQEQDIGSLMVSTPTPTPINTPTPTLAPVYEFDVLKISEENSYDENITAKSALLIDLTEGRTLFAKNIYNKLYPASTTKLLTALLTMKYCNFDDTVTVAEDNGGITIKGAQLCGFKQGDVVSVGTLFECMMVYSGNDAANILAQHIAGDLSGFKKKAAFELELLGAQNTSFVNPHGLHEEKHFTTAYDLYLIFNECIKYNMFNYIIQADKIAAEYKDATGNDVRSEFETTSFYHTGKGKIPEGFNIIGGKTGTTYAAGNCLVLLSQNPDGHLIFSALFGVSEQKQLYEQMSYFLTLSK